jgi:hypothetical protein
MSKAEKLQFVLVDGNQTIQAIILVRGDEFYCYERCEDSPPNFKAAVAEYPDCRLVQVELKSVEPPVLATK